MLNPLSEHPASGIGTAVGIGSAVILVAGMTAGGFVAGKLAGMDGIIHGFLVWATTLIVAVILGIFLAVGTAKMTANALGAVSSVTVVSYPERAMLLEVEFPHYLRRQRNYLARLISTQS